MKIYKEEHVRHVDYHFVWVWWSRVLWRPRRFLWGFSERAGWLVGWGSCWSPLYSRANSGTGPDYWRWHFHHTRGPIPAGERRFIKVWKQFGVKQRNNGNAPSPSWDRQLGVLVNNWSKYRNIDWLFYLLNHPFSILAQYAHYFE